MQQSTSIRIFIKILSKSDLLHELEGRNSKNMKSKSTRTAMIIEISVRRSTQQMSRSYAVRSIVAIVELRNLYFDPRDRVNMDPLFVPPKRFFREPDDVPIGRPLLSSSLNVFISL